MASYFKLKVGETYTKPELVIPIGEDKVGGIQTGLMYCETRPTTLLFVTLDKGKREEHLRYNDYFEKTYFHWDSQARQNALDNRIKSILNGTVDVHLFVRIKAKTTRGKGEKFCYAGELINPELQNGNNFPSHILFKVKDYVSSPNSTLKAIYDWKPKDAGATTFVQKDYKREVSDERKKDYIEPNETERKGLVNSRIGQGYFRELVIDKWKGKCAFTGCSEESILIASHIVPWRDATNEERLNPDNGILLSPNIDALFDQNLISFENDGGLVISPKLNAETLDILNITKETKIDVDEDMIRFLKRHRDKTLNNI